VFPFFYYTARNMTTKNPSGSIGLIRPQLKDKPYKKDARDGNEILR